MLVIPSATKSTGSGRGLSYWEPYACGCPRRKALERQPGFDKTLDPETGERKTDRYGRPKLDTAKIGVLLHTLVEHYHKGTLPSDDVQLVYQDGNEDLEWEEALRLFRTYRKITEADAFGKVLAVERRFEVDPVTALKLFGVPEFTGRIDGEVMIEDIDKAFEGGRVQIPEPGLYFYDLKQYTRHEANLTTQMMEAEQFHAYMMAARERGEDVKGTIANVVIRKKDPEPVRVCVPFPTPRQQKVVKDILSRAYFNKQTFGEDFANPHHDTCFAYGYNCPFLNSQCDRTTGIVWPNFTIELGREKDDDGDWNS